MRLLQAEQHRRNGRARGRGKAGGGTARHQIALPSALAHGEHPTHAATRCGTHLHRRSLVVTKGNAEQIGEQGRCEYKDQIAQPPKGDKAAQ